MGFLWPVTKQIIKMASNERKTVEELTKIRLKLIEQKIAAEKQKRTQQQQFVGPTDNSLNSDPRYALQAEILKSQQLLQQVQEERHNLQTRTRQNRQAQRQRQTETRHNQRDDRQDPNSEMVAMVLAQSVQLQGMMLKQMNPIPTHNNINNQTQRPEHNMPVEYEQVSYRQMTPFTSLPQNKPAPKTKAAAPLIAIPPRKASPVKVTRAAATPVRPSDIIPQPTRPKTKTPPATGFLNKPSSYDPDNDPYPFPGTKGIRKLRHLFLATWFCFILISLLKKAARRRAEVTQRLDECIQASIVELHEKFYLNQDNPIWTAMYDLIKDGCINANVKSPGMFQKLPQEAQNALSDLSSIVETIVYNITEIRPIDGLLGPSQEGVLWYMLQSDVVLPADYLWQVEKDKLKFTEKGMILHQDVSSSILLVVSLFLSRGLVSSILLQPVESGLSPHIPSNTVQDNLKVLASILMKIVREVSVPAKSKPMQIPSEISVHLFTDDEIKYIYKKLDSTLIWSKANLTKWATSFVDLINKT